MNIQILDEAQADLREGAQFYERQNIGLGTYFLDTIFSDIDFNSLRRCPYSTQWLPPVAIKNFPICSLLSNRC